MGKSDFLGEIDDLKNWHLTHKPVLFLPAADKAWETIWKTLEQLVVPTEHVWINFDDGEGSCFLSSFEDAPSPEKVAYVALYVTELKNTYPSGTYLLTDQDIECEACAGTDEECPTCDGTGVEWLELDDLGEVSRQPEVLGKYFPLT